MKVTGNLPNTESLAGVELEISLGQRWTTPERLKTKEGLVAMEVSKSRKLEQEKISKVT